jgi:Predicted metal-sulfur cluster biosynthetic enzyme
MLNQEERDQLKETIVEAVLKKMYDPEIPVDIYTLGLIYQLNIDEEGNVKIVMTVTAPNCPVAEVLPGAVKEKVKAVMGVKDVVVELTFEPPWSIDKLSDETKAELGLDGDYGNFNAMDMMY